MVVQVEVRLIVYCSSAGLQLRTESVLFLLSVLEASVWLVEHCSKKLLSDPEQLYLYCCSSELDIQLDPLQAPAHYSIL